MSELVTITSFTEPLEAHIVKGLLESQGIKTFIGSEHHVSAVWYLSNALGGVRLLVHKQDKSHAKEVIKSYLKGEYVEEISNEPLNVESNKCPKCGSMEVSSKFPFWLLMLVWLSLIFLFIFPINRSKHKCKKCGNRWVC